MSNIDYNIHNDKKDSAEQGFKFFTNEINKTDICGSISY